jgi:hypothetical protein
MDVVEKRAYHLKRANKSWNILLNSLSDHMNVIREDEIRRCVYSKKNVIMIVWTLVM